MAGDIIGVPTTFTGLSITSTPGSAQTYPAAIPVLAVAGGSQVTISSNVSIILGSVTTLTLSGAAVSWRTISGGASLSSLGPTTLDNGQLGLCFAASGMSLIYRSGNTIYTVGASAVSAAAP